MDKQHTQLPNDMLDASELVPKDLLIYVTIKRHQNSKTKEAFPSLDTICKESGASKPTVRKCIENLKKAGYITVRKKGRNNIYKFNPYVKFEPFSEEFLDSTKIDSNVKAYILGTQEHLFKNEKGFGATSYSDKQLAEKLNLDTRTVAKYNKILEEKGFLDIIKTDELDKETGLNIEQKIFHLSKLGQSIIWTLQNHEERIQENTRTAEVILEENKKLKDKLNETDKKVALLTDIMKKAGIDINLNDLNKYPDSITL